MEVVQEHIHNLKCQRLNWKILIQKDPRESFAGCFSEETTHIVKVFIDFIEKYFRYRSREIFLLCILNLNNKLR